MNKTVLTSFTILCLLSTVFLMGIAFNIQTVRASGTIYIRADGSIDPPTAHISSVDNVTYTFTGNINESVVVERSNIIIDGNGYTLQGNGSGSGLDLFSVDNVTIQDVNFKDFSFCVRLSESSSNTLTNNNITTNGLTGIFLSESFNNTICGNNIVNNEIGVYFFPQSSNNKFYHNNFIDNIVQIGGTVGTNTWDDGYPSGGNYWDDHICAGNPTNGSQPYVIDENNIDHYPFQDPDGWLKVHNVDTGLSYETIQEAINDDATLNWHTIKVDAGTYYEHVVVNKTLFLVGEDRATTLIDGNNTGTVVTIEADDVYITNFTITNSGSDYGLRIDYQSGCRISRNIITNNDCGIYLEGSRNTLVDNIIFSNYFGVVLESSSKHNFVVGNNVTDNKYSGILLWGHCDSNTVAGNIASNNTDGIRLWRSSGNTVAGNNVSNNDCGIRLEEHSESNMFYHNNFINNTSQVGIHISYVNAWDDDYPSGGNYWSDHVCSGDPSDGSQPYIIDVNNIDHYPFQHPCVHPKEDWLKVHNINTGLNYAAIQGAINAPETLDGHTIQVDAGTYYGMVWVRKSVALIGENRDTTIIDGEGHGDVISVSASYVTIANFTLINSGGFPYACVDVEHCDYNRIVNNNLPEIHQYGINLYASDHNIIGGNLILGGVRGIHMQASINNTIIDNDIQCRQYGVGVRDSFENKIAGNTFSNNVVGIFLLNSMYNRVVGNTVVGSDRVGIEITQPTSIHHRGYNVVYCNDLIDNEYGLWIDLSRENEIIHNNFVNNTSQVFVSQKYYVNIWDDGSEGNYWSDYNGTDVDRDGIGDTPYIIDENNQDNFPLKGTFSDFNILWKEEIYHVTAICNSTISDFRFRIGTETGKKAISFNVSGEDGTVGFCRVMIPTDLMNYSYIVIFDGEEIIPTSLDISNETHSYLYFTYAHSTHTVTIVSSKLLYLYYQLLNDYAELLMDFASLNSTYYELLDDYALLLGNYSQLLESYHTLNASYQQHLLNYSDLQGNFNSLNSTYNQLQGQYELLNSSYTALKSDQEATVNELGTIRNLMYVFIATTITLIAATVYFAIRKPKIKQ